MFWGNDALSFAHTIPTCLFTLQILVPDLLPEKAAEGISRVLPHYIFPESLAETREYECIDPNSLTCCPERSIYA